MDLITFFTGIVVPTVAVLAFVISLYNAYNQWKRDRPNISLDCSYSDTTFYSTLGDVKDPKYTLSATNLGNGNVIISDVGFKWKKILFYKIYKRDYYRINFDGECKELPFKIEPSKKMFAEFYPKEIDREILESKVSGSVKVIFFIKDGNGKIYKAAPIEIDITQPTQHS
jgi:hypothetical protein